MPVCDWQKVESDVVERIRFLRAIDEKLQHSEAEAEAAVEKLRNDLIRPVVGYLTAFCASVAIDEEDETTDHASPQV